jgi:hypothetical protein
MGPSRRIAGTCWGRMEIAQTILSGVPLHRVIGDVDHFGSSAFGAAARRLLEGVGLFGDKGVIMLPDEQEAATLVSVWTAAGCPRASV